jgi:hypothetical protein
MDEKTKNINKDDILKQTSTLIDRVEKAYKAGTAAHKVEQDIFTELLKMGHMLLSYLFDLYQGDEQQGETIELSDGSQVKRLSMKHKRSYLSIFGEFNLSRWVYGTREGQKIDYIPMDKLLQLPCSKYSYLLQDWGQSLVVSVPYAEASKIMQRIFSVSIPVSGLERTVLSTSTSSHPYFDQQTSIKPAEQGQVVVTSADCKGVVIRKPGVEEADSTQKTMPINIEQTTPKGHFGNKKMAVVGASYSVDPYPRTPEKVLESLFRPKGVSVVKDSKQSRPKPVNKHVRACMDRDEKDTLQPARETIFSWLGDEVKQRNPTGNNTVVLIMDGEKKLWEMDTEMIAAENSVQILDIIHAASYLVPERKPQNSIQKLFPTYFQGRISKKREDTPLINIYYLMVIV